MASLHEIVAFLDQLLETDRVPEKYATNGLQVEGPESVTRVGFCVDASWETAEKLQDCQLMIVHHGIFWPSLARLTGPNFRLVKKLIGQGTALYASHLPLDVHAEVGNNAQLLEVLGLERQQLFPPVGWIGTGAELELDSFHERVQERVGPARLLAFGPSRLERIAVSSGQSSVPMVTQAAAMGAQLLLTGEASHPIYHAAQEAGLSVMLAGHYATETWGVKALMPLLVERFGVSTHFVDVPTGF